MATYQDIRRYVLKKYGFVPTTCWISHAKELCGIPVRKASNRIDPDKRIDPCPEGKLPAIRDAFEFFGMISLFVIAAGFGEINEIDSRTR